MGKVKQRNWLLLITGFLFLTLSLLLYVKMKEGVQKRICFFNDSYYSENELVSNYNGKNDCYCTENGTISCASEEVSLSYSSFSSANLNFSYNYLNSLDELVPDYSRIIPVDVNHEGNSLSVSFERESLCSSDVSAPPQSGYYELKESSLVLTTLTNKDTSVYTVPCLISNVYKISSISIPNTESFSILYRNEEGKLFDLNVCYYNGSLFGTGDVFESSQSGRICSCDSGVIECE